MTYGNLKLRLCQAFPGISLDLLEGFCNDRYQEILAELPWTREDISAALQTRAPFTTGSVAVTQGSVTVTVTGASWSSSLNGLAFRVTGDVDFYEFLATSPTTGALDRPYDGATASAAGYSLSQFIYVLPADCQLLADDAFTSRLGPMKRFTHEQIIGSDPQRAMTGTPTNWATYMGDDSVPPRLQIELWPIPDDFETLFYTYQSFAGDLAGEATILQVWMEPSALYDGVVSRAKAHIRDYQGAAFHAAIAEKALKQMRSSEANAMALGQMGLSQYYVGYRSRKYSR